MNQELQIEKAKQYDGQQQFGVAARGMVVSDGQIAERLGWLNVPNEETLRKACAMLNQPLADGEIVGQTLYGALTEHRYENKERTHPTTGEVYTGPYKLGEDGQTKYYKYYKIKLAMAPQGAAQPSWSYGAVAKNGVAA